MSLITTLSSPARTARIEDETAWRSRVHTALPRRGASRRADRPNAEQAGDLAAASDEELLVRYRDARRPADLTELYRRYNGQLSRCLGRYLGDAALAEDILQDTFLLVHSKCHLYGDGWPVRPWLYAVAMNRAVEVQRHARRHRNLRIDLPLGEDGPESLLDLLAGDDPGPLEELQERDRQDWVRENVARLPDHLRHTLVLTYYQGLSYAEVAGLLHVPLGTVKSRLHGAIARMRAMAERMGRP
jgi:RNA polymerase sigma-70 factor (ECF subfamily)